VKAYAADYCDISELRQASREQVATFIQHLGEYAQSDRDGLLCQLNSYVAKPVASADGTIGDAGAAKVGVLRETPHSRPLPSRAAHQ